MSGAQRLRLELNPSRALAAAVLGIHAIAAACIFVVLPGPAGTALAALVLALGIAATWDRALLRGSRAPRIVEISAGGEAFIILTNGAAAQAKAVRGSGVNRFWVALKLAGSPARRSVLVTWDMLDRESFRLLRLWAVWGRVPGVASGQLPA